jgi:ketosteroid isomerase-like protein
MKIRLLFALVGFAIGPALPTIAQEKEEANPFLYRAILATPQLAQQLDPINSQFDEAFNKRDAVAVAALFTEKATIVTPLGIFSGRDGVEKHFTDVFHRFPLSDRLTKNSYVYAFADDLCAIGGWTVTYNPGRPRPVQAGGYLIRVYTRVRDTWKIRVEVDKYMTGAGQ